MGKKERGGKSRQEKTSPCDAGLTVIKEKGQEAILCRKTLRWQCSSESPSQPTWTSSKKSDHRGEP